MKWPDFFLILGITASCNAACRVLPITVLANRHMPARVERALKLIPAACFAALVTNDLFNPAAFSQGITFQTMLPFLASLPVVVVSIRKRSLFLSVLVGLGCYSLLYCFA